MKRKNLNELVSMMKLKESKSVVPITIFIITFGLLAFVQMKVENPMLLAERFFKGSGWLEIMIISIYGAFVAMNMQDVRKAPKWRKTIWTVFSLVFFTQLLAGLTLSEKFLMTGKLHLPIPMMILGGTINQLLDAHYAATVWQAAIMIQ